MNDLPIRTVQEHLVHENPWWQVWFDDVVFPSGASGRHMRLQPTLPRPGAVAMVCDSESSTPVRVLLVRQWRYAQRTSMWEFPRGFADLADPDALTTAAREVLEESGLTILSAEMLGSICADSAIIGGQVASVLVHAGSKKSSTDDEVSDAAWVDLHELLEMVRAGAVTDAYTLATLALYLAARPPGC